MASTRDPLHSTEASGMSGPIVAVPGRRGTNLRAWQNQCDPKSRLQTWYRREGFAYVVRWWSWLEYVLPAGFDLWAAYARSRNGDPQGKSLSPRDWFMRYQLRRFRYGMVAYWPPPPPGACTYSPQVSVAWTAPGAILTFAPAIPAWHRIIVRQARNQGWVRLRPVQGHVSHILDDGDPSPINLTGPIGGPPQPPDWPPVSGGTTQHFHVWALDNYARSTPTRFWRILIP